MAKLQRFHLENECYHITTAVRERAAVFYNAEYAGVVVEAIQFIRRKQAHVLAYIVMPDHLHIVLAPKPGHNISRIMQSIKGYTARSINARRGSRGPLWQLSFYDRIINDEVDLFNTIEYVHMNPVVAGLVDEPEAYQFSSAGKDDMIDLERFS